VVVTGTRTPERQQRATVKTDVVSRAEAERRGATNVAEALQSQPGVQVNPGNYGAIGGASAIQIQGFDRDRVLVLEDGERVVGDVGGAIDLATLPLNDVSRVEVVTGPTSALYGSSAIGGVVNVLTAPPIDEGPSGRVRLERRSLNGWVGQASGAYRRGRSWGGVDLNYVRADGVRREASKPDLQVPETERKMVGLRGGFALGPGVELRARVRRFADRLEGVGSREVPGVGLLRIRLPDEIDRTTAHLVGDYRLAPGATLRMTLGRQWYEGRSRKEYDDSPVNERRTRSYGMQSIEAVATVADGPRTWVFGARGEAERFDQTLAKTESSSAGLVESSLAEVPPVARASGAGYAQLSWAPGDGKLTVLPGVRYEVYNRYGQSLAPRLALAYRPHDWLTLRASAGRGFRAPSAKELGFVFDHSIYGYRLQGNLDLGPESSWGGNADVSLGPAAGFTLRAGAYVNRVERLIDIDLAAGVTGDDGVVTYRYTNRGRAETAGGQIAVGYRLADRLRADLSYDYLWTRDASIDRPLPGRPMHTVTASTQLGPFEKFELYLRLRAVSDAYLDGVSRGPAYTMFDARLARALWSRSQAYVGLLNALDVHQEPGRVGDTRPPIGRVLYVGLRAEFPWEEDQ
jgi:outer membrane receptor for ferrienterochelin and colicins